METVAGNISVAQPAELCGHAILRCLTPGQTYLATAPGGREVVLEVVDEDCLLRGNLHPSIRERLSRVRELAHAGVANLHGVGREGPAAYMIWEYVPGRSFDEFVNEPARTPRELLMLARELILSVDTLHMQGIVHGALVGGNVIVLPDRSIRLTHVSPLLFTDPSVDVECVVDLLKRAAARAGDGSPLSGLMAGVETGPTTLRALAGKVAVLLESRDAGGTPPPVAEERAIRRRTLVAAVVVTILSILVGYGIWRATAGRPDLAGPFHWTQGDALK